MAAAKLPPGQVNFRGKVLRPVAKGKVQPEAVYLRKGNTTPHAERFSITTARLRAIAARMKNE